MKTRVTHRMMRDVILREQRLELERPRGVFLYILHLANGQRVAGLHVALHEDSLESREQYFDLARTEAFGKLFHMLSMRVADDLASLQADRDDADVATLDVFRRAAANVNRKDGTP